MKITKENTGSLNAVITVLIEQKDYEKTVTDKLREYRLKAALPGFRPGKVPASLIQKRFAKPILAEEVNNLLSNNLNEYLKEEHIALLGDPLPDREKQKTINWDTDTDFEFIFDIAISPEIRVDLNHFAHFDYYRIKVDEQMVNESIESARMRFGTNTESDVVSGNSSVRGDFVQLGENGKALEGGISPEGVLIAVDLMKDETTKTEITGKKCGDIIVFDPVTVYGDRHEIGHMLNISHEAAETLDSNFSFTIKNILNFQKAELNENLYKKIYGEESGITTEEQFKERLSEEISQRLAYSSDKKFALDARDNLILNTDFELPEEFLKRWLKEANKEMTKEQIENNFVNFTKDLRWQLIKNAIIKEHEIIVSKEETMDYARQVAISQFYQYGVYQIPDEHLDSFTKKIMEKDEDREGIVRRIYENKVIGVVKEKGTIVEKEISSEEFNAMMNNIQEEES